MTMDVKCSAITSIALKLTYDDQSTKKALVAVGDLVWMVFNYNGCRREVEARVLKITANGDDPRAWMILIDSSEDFGATQYRVCPLNIIDIEVIKKAAAAKFVESPPNYTNIAGIRVVDGRLQYTQDNINWYPFRIDRRDIIMDESYGPVINDGVVTNHHPHPAGGDIGTDGIYEEEGN